MRLILHFFLFFSVTSVFAAEQNSRVLKVVFGIFRPPYVFEKTNRGLDVEIAVAVFSKMKLKTESLHSPNDRALKEIEEGKVDAVVSISADSGLKKVCYTEPILFYDNVAISKQKSKIELKSVADLKNHSFLSFSKASRYLGAEYSALVTNLNRDTDTTNQRRQNILFWEDKVNIIILDLNIFKYYRKELSALLKTNDEIVVHRIFDVKANPRVVAFNQKDLCSKFNKALVEIKSDGTYQKILDKYLSMIPN